MCLLRRGHVSRENLVSVNEMLLSMRSALNSQKDDRLQRILQLLDEDHDGIIDINLTLKVTGSFGRHVALRLCRLPCNKHLSFTFTPPHFHPFPMHDVSALPVCLCSVTQLLPYPRLDLGLHVGSCVSFMGKEYM